MASSLRRQDSSYPIRGRRAAATPPLVCKLSTTRFRRRHNRATATRGTLWSVRPWTPTSLCHTTASRCAHPDHLAVLACLHGIESPEPGACRVLGGLRQRREPDPDGLVSPGSRFSDSICRLPRSMPARRRSRRLQLHNIEIRQADVGTVDLGDEGFDMSSPTACTPGVPAPVRVALLGLIRRHLNPGGVAYLSFNALPGWHMRGMLREMLLFHVRALAGGRSGWRRHASFWRFWMPAWAVCRRSVPNTCATNWRHSGRHRTATWPRVPGNGERTGAVQRFPSPMRSGRPALPVQRGAALPVSGRARRDRGAGLAAFTDPLARQQYLDFLLNRWLSPKALLVGDDSARPGELDYERFTRLALFADLSPPLKARTAQTKPQLFTDSAGDGTRYRIR